MQTQLAKMQQILLSFCFLNHMIKMCNLSFIFEELKHSALRVRLTKLELLSQGIYDK